MLGVVYSHAEDHKSNVPNKPTARIQNRPLTSTPQLPFKEHQIPSNRDHKALNRGTLGGLGIAPSTHWYLPEPLSSAGLTSKLATADPCWALEDPCCGGLDFKSLPTSS